MIVAFPGYTHLLFRQLIGFWYLSHFQAANACADPKGGPGVQPPPPLKNHKNIGSLSNSGPDPLKNYEATEPEFNIGPSSARQRNAI